jgi:hypothetical protein
MNTRTRWVDEPWAWFVLGLPIAAVLACVVTAVIAIRSQDALVVDDYYKRGLAINRVLAREQAARDAGLDVDIEFGSSGTLALRLRADGRFDWPPSIDVKLTHATRADADRKFVLGHRTDGRYIGTVGELAAGPWYVDCATDAWRLVKRIELSGR